MSSLLGRRISLTLRFKIPVNVPIQMQIFQSRDDFRSVELGMFLRETFVRTGLKCSKEFSSHAVLSSALLFSVPLFLRDLDPGESEVRGILTSRTKNK